MEDTHIGFARPLAILGLAALLVLPSIAGAAGPAGPADADGDGRISYDEHVESAARRVMQALDKDGNGVLSREELPPAQGAATSAGGAVDFSAVDGNGDGQIDLDELKAALHENAQVRFSFDQADSDNDHFLSADELRKPDGEPAISIVPEIHFKF